MEAVPPFERVREVREGGKIKIGDSTVEILDGRATVKVIAPTCHVSFFGRQRPAQPKGGATDQTDAT